MDFGIGRLFVNGRGCRSAVPQLVLPLVGLLTLQVEGHTTRD